MRRLLIIILSLSFTLAGCSVNPVTGEKNFVLPNLDVTYEFQGQSSKQGARSKKNAAR